jgi:hypothetical protein
VHAAAGIWSMLPDARLVELDTWKSAIRKTILEEICSFGKNHNECQDQLSREFGEAIVATLKNHWIHDNWSGQVRTGHSCGET